MADFQLLPRRDYNLQLSLQIWTLNKDTAYVANQTDKVTLGLIQSFLQSFLF